MSDPEPQVIEFVPDNFEEIARLTGYELEEIARIHAADLTLDHVRYLYVRGSTVHFHVERRTT